MKQAGENRFLPGPSASLTFIGMGITAVLELLYRIAGRGTSLFSRMRSGDEATLLGPLGRGFTLPDRDQASRSCCRGSRGSPVTFSYSQWISD